MNRKKISTHPFNKNSVGMFKLMWSPGHKTFTIFVLITNGLTFILLTLFNFIK